MAKDGAKKPRRLLKFFLVLFFILIGIVLVWTAFSLIGRISSDSAISPEAILRVSVSNPMRLINGVLAHESLDEIIAAPALASVSPVVKTLEEGSLLQNPLVRLAAKGSLELALLPPTEDGQAGPMVAVWDMGFFSPLLRLLPLLSGFVTVPDLYYVQAGKNSRFEYRLSASGKGQTFYIGPHHNLLYITDNSQLFESRSIKASADPQKGKAYQTIKPSAYDAAMLLSPEFIEGLLSAQNADMAEVLQNMSLSSPAEAGLSVSPQKLELRITTQVASHRAALDRMIESRSRAPELADHLPASVQYATVLSAGTLEELYQAALVFSGASLEDTLKQADTSSRLLLGLRLDELLYSWSGNEFATFGMEGRPHPVYAIQIADERKRQEIFDKAFKSIVLNENTRLTLDGTRIPRIEVPAFLQSLLNRWDMHLPSPYYLIYRDCLFASESAETLLAAVRAMQKNDVLPKTAEWRNIAGGRSAASAFSLYYSLDLSMPFFLKGNTALSGFLGVYRRGLLRMSFDKGLADITLALVPGSGRGVTLASGYPLDAGGKASNRVYRAGKGADSRVFFIRGTSAVSVNIANNTVNELSGQGQLWVIPANDNDAAAWVVTERGRVTLVNGDMEPAQGFPVLTGLRLSAPPAAHESKLFLCSEDEKVYVVDINGNQSEWESSFPAALRSPPSFLTVQVGRGNRATSNHYAAVYPKSFFGELWLVDLDGKALPNWPVPLFAFDEPAAETHQGRGSPPVDNDINTDGEIEETAEGESSVDYVQPTNIRPAGGSGIGFGSPLVFANNNRVFVAFVSQAGELSLFDENAVPVSGFPLVLEGVFYQQPVFDGTFLWLASDNGTLVRVSFEGEALYQRIPGFAVKEEGYLTFFDCDGDGSPEIFITGEGNALYGYTRNFRSLEGFPLPVWGRPVFVEASGNEKREIIGMGMDNRLYRWQFK